MPQNLFHYVFLIRKNKFNPFDSAPLPTLRFEKDDFAKFTNYVT